MKKIFMLILSIHVLLSCQKNNNEELESDELPVLEIGTVKIKAQDDRTYSFSLKKDSTYTLLVDTRNYNYCPSEEVDGWQHMVYMDWGISNQAYVFGNSFGYKNLADIKSPMFALCIIPLEDFIYKLKMYDIDYRDNTGYATVSLEYGDKLFNKGVNNFEIKAGDYKMKNLYLYPKMKNKIWFDFSKHTFDLKGGEPRGWRNKWYMQLNKSLPYIDYGVGTKENPRALVPKIALYIEPIYGTSMQVYVLPNKETIDDGNISYGISYEPD